MLNILVTIAQQLKSDGIVGSTTICVVYSVIHFLIVREEESPSIYSQVCDSRPLIGAYKDREVLSDI